MQKKIETDINKITFCDIRITMIKLKLGSGQDKGLMYNK